MEELLQATQELDGQIMAWSEQYERNLDERDAMLAAAGVTIEQLEEFERNLPPEQRRMLEDMIHQFGEERGIYNTQEEAQTKAPRLKRGIPV